MKTRETTFERFEYKYWMTAEVLEDLMCEARPFLHCDEWATDGQHNTSLYLDSPDLDFARLHTESAPDRIKLRIRAYGNPPSGDAFFEIKRKVKDVTLKRRAIVPLTLVPEILSSLWYPQLGTRDEEQTLSHFLYLMVVHRAQPTALVTCRRAAYASADPGEGLRLTVDRDICYQAARGASLYGDRHAWRSVCGMGSIPPNATALVEIKFRGTAPRWIQDTVQRLGLQRCNFSKYIAAVLDDEPRAEDLTAAAPRRTRLSVRTAKAA